MNEKEIAPPSARQWAMLCHLCALSGLLGNGIGFFLGPLIVWLIKKDEHPFIDSQGKEAVNFQLTMIIAAILASILIIIGIGFILLIIVGIVMVVLPIIGAIKANEGEDFKYPFSIRLIS